MEEYNYRLGSYGGGPQDPILLAIVTANEVLDTAKRLPLWRYPKERDRLVTQATALLTQAMDMSKDRMSSK